MFPNLKAELARKKMDLKMLSAATGINYETLKNKVRGTTEFKLAEMVSIMKVFPQFSMDYIFTSDGETENEE